MQYSSVYSSKLRVTSQNDCIAATDFLRVTVQQYKNMLQVEAPALNA